jgi:hypothetical protein
LWWDGGGKGERFIQQIKPHIKKGVREDAPTFFVGLMEKIYRHKVTELLEQRYGLTAEVGGKGEIEDTQTLNDALMAAEAEESVLKNSDEEEYDSSDSDDEGSYEVSDEEIEEEEVRAELYQFTRAEEEGMLKQSTIYIYRNWVVLNHSITHLKPIAGFLKYEDESLVFYCVYRVPVKNFCTIRIVFDDTQGQSFFGLWYARTTIVQNDGITTTDSFKEIQDSAKAAAVAIPLHYVIGKDKAGSDWYSVTTNWWQHRFEGGDYKLPALDRSFYVNTGSTTRTEDLMAAEHPENVI